MNEKGAMKRILTGLLDMIVDLEKIVRNHDDRLDLITQAGRDQALGSLGVIEAMRGLLDSQEDQRDEIDALKNQVEFLTEDIRDLKTEIRNLEGLRKSGNEAEGE